MLREVDANRADEVNGKARCATVDRLYLVRDGVRWHGEAHPRDAISKGTAQRFGEYLRQLRGVYERLRVSRLA